MNEILQQLSGFSYAILYHIDNIIGYIWDWTLVKDSYYESLIRHTIFFFFTWLIFLLLSNFIMIKDSYKIFIKMSLKEENISFTGEKSNYKTLILLSLLCAYISASFGVMYIFDFWGLNTAHHFWMDSLQILPTFLLPIIIWSIICFDYLNEKLIITTEYIYYRNEYADKIYKTKSLEKFNLSEIERLELNKKNKKSIAKNELIFHFTNGEKKNFYSYINDKAVNKINVIIKQ